MPRIGSPDFTAGTGRHDLRIARVLLVLRRARHLGRSQIGIASSMSIVSESVTAIRLRKRALAPSKKISSR